MKETRNRKHLYLPVIFLITIPFQSFCKKGDVDFYELQDLLGNWTFMNAVTADYKEFIAPVWNIRLNSDKTYFIEALSNQNMPSFDCRGNQFRLLLHYPIFNTHMVIRFLWIGKISGSTELAGKIHLAVNPNSGNDIWDYGKGTEIGSFTARRLLD